LCLYIETQRDVLLLLVEQFNSRKILETVNDVGAFDKKSHEGIAFQIDVEDAVGVMHQIEVLTQNIEEEI
jgi:hypothetical protein